MKWCAYLIIILQSFLVLGQENKLAFQFEKKESLNTERFIGIDYFDYIYSVSDNTLHKKNDQKEYVYTELQLGEITSVDISNSLKIVVFYKDQNTVVILDNTLSEIIRINFNNLEDFRKVTQASSANDNNLWIFNELTQELELFNYINNKTIIRTIPLTEPINYSKSDYNYCWILTQNHIKCFNSYGSLVSENSNNDFNQFTLFKNNILLSKQNDLYYLNSANEIQKISLNTEISIKDFSINNETLYIYDGLFLYFFKLIK